MTELEAKTKWCPFARVGVRWMDSQAETLSDLTAIAVNRGANATERASCIGSACMAWRWDRDDFEERVERYENAANVGGITDRGPVPECFGFCGLVGKP